ncbi:MAG TPA: hypothetical protein VFW19_08770 [Allosphingosinicella sp.]|nr:hypothetical protein [Allosphingosinicella sp.]
MTERDQRIYGGLLLASALLSLLAAAHHPEIHAHDLATALRTLAGETRFILAVHGVLIALALAELIGFYGFARLLGPGRPLPAAGLIFMAVGMAAMVGAAAINGLAVPAFASDYRGLAPADMKAAAMLLRLCWDLNQALASIGALAWGAALLAWSVALAGRSGLVRATGLLGLVAGLAIIGGLLSGLIDLHVGGFIALVALMTAWSVATALLMLTGRLAAARPGGSASPA